MSQFNSTEVRGEQLIDQIETITAITGKPKVNLIGHSHGGLDVRYVAAVRPDLVASVTSRRHARTRAPTWPTTSRRTSTGGSFTEGVLAYFANSLGTVLGSAHGVDAIRRTRSPALGSLTSAGTAVFNASYPQGVPGTSCGEGAAVVNGIRYYSWCGTGILTNVLDVSDTAYGSHLVLLQRGERRARRSLQLPPRRRDPRQLLPEPSGRGEPDPRAGLDLRVEPHFDLQEPREPAQEPGLVDAVGARVRVLMGAAGVLAGGMAIWLAARAPDETGTEPARDPAPARVSASSVPRDARASAELPPLPASLAGTRPDGALVRDADGRFVPTHDALDLFDYFFSASGEEPDARIRARIEAAIAEQLDDPAPALDLLDRYLGYRAEARALFTEENAAALPLERRLQRIRELRRAHFGELADALFADEEERWRADIERLRVLHDPALAAEERATRLAALDAELPESVREARAAATAASSLRREEERLRAEGASDAEIGALREARFGREAAERLAAIDQARAAWHARVSAYRAERERMAALELGDAEARAAAIAALRDAYFEGAERLRIEALDRLEAQTAAAAPGAASPAN